MRFYDNSLQWTAIAISTITVKNLVGITVGADGNGHLLQHGGVSAFGRNDRISAQKGLGADFVQCTVIFSCGLQIETFPEKDGISVEIGSHPLL